MLTGLLQAQALHLTGSEEGDLGLRQSRVWPRWNLERQQPLAPRNRELRPSAHLRAGSRTLAGGCTVWKFCTRLSQGQRRTPRPTARSSSFKKHLIGPALEGTCTPVPTRRAQPGTRTCTHSDTVTVSGRESPSLPLRRGCLFRQGDLAVRQHRELQRVLGGRGDLEGPGKSRAIERREDAKSPETEASCPARSPRAGDTYHLTHVSRLALLSRRSWQTLRRETHQTLGSRHCSTGHARTASAVSPARPQAEQPKGSGMWSSMHRYRGRSPPEPRAPSQPQKTLEEFAKIYGQSAYCKVPSNHKP